MPDSCNPRDCPLVPRVEALESANKEHSQTHREIFRRLNDVEKETGEQGVTLKNIDEKLDRLISWQEDQRDRFAKIDSIAELSQRLTSLEAKPGKRWDSVVEKVILVVVGAVVGLALVRLGLSA